MELKLEFGEAYCYTPAFEINGILANPDDFGDQRDESPDTAEEFGCGDMQFKAKEYTQKVSDKYKITIPEYNFVASQLEVGLSFGACGYCI